MKLPNSITPCPIAEVVVDVRFETTIPEDAVFGVVYQALRKDFPKSSPLPLASLPTEIRKADPQLANQPLYRLEGEHLAVMVGAQSVNVGIRGAYAGWTTVSEQFRTTMARIGETGIIGTPQRFGLRYINFFEGDILPSLTFSVTVASQLAHGDETFFKTVLKSEGCRLLLQVGKDLMLVGGADLKPIGGTKTSGSVIDIDTFVQNPEGVEGFDASLSKFLEVAHLAEKKLFFSLLKEEFLETLNPIYPDEK